MSQHPQRILIADDNRDLATIWGALFGDRGHFVHLEHDGQSACDAAMKLRPNAVLLDIGMPRMSGHEVARAIRRQPWGKNVLLLAMSGWGDPKDKKCALEAGFNHHCTKPADFDEVVGLVEGRCADGGPR